MEAPPCRPTRRLQVYLDSSDFSRFGDVLLGKGSLEDTEILQQLTALRERVDFRFSQIHIAEAAPLTDLAVSRAVSRAASMVQLCGTKALIPYYLLPALDFAASEFEPSVSLPRDRMRFHACDDGGGWFPVHDFETTFGEMRLEVAKLQSAPVSTLLARAGMVSLGREARRKMERRMSPRRFTQQLSRSVPDLWPQLEAKWRTAFPMSPETSRVIQRMIMGSETPELATMCLRSDLADLPELMRILGPATNGPLTYLPKWIREPSAKFVSTLAASATQLQRMREIYRDAPTAQRQSLHQAWERHASASKVNFEQSWSALVRQQISSERHLLARWKVPYSDPREDAVRAYSSWTSTSMLFAEYLRKLISPTEMERSLEKATSDFGDMMHASYIPHVDIIRLDGYAAQYARGVAAHFNTCVVSKVALLPEAIRQRLSSPSDTPSII